MNINPILRQAFNDLDNTTPAADDSSPAPQYTPYADVPIADTADPKTVAQKATHEADEASVAQPANTFARPSREPLKVKGLDEKAVLVQLRRSMFGTSRRDEVETAAYGAGNVVKHLFEDKTCRMADVKSAYSEVYIYVNDNTVPWAKGVRMLNIDNYIPFTQGLRSRIDHANAKVADLVANWDYEVQRDLARLSAIETAKGKAPGSLASPDNYPSSDEIGDRFGIDVRFLPVPTVGDFRVNISDEDKASLQKQLAEAEEVAARHVIEQMLAPMQRAVEKLTVPIGQDGAVFRDSLIDNIVEVAERMEKVNLSDDPAIRSQITALKDLARPFANDKNALRKDQSARDDASKQIGGLIRQMSGLV